MKPYIRNLPGDITSYDFLKTLAVITMVIDHIGYYFFPEQNEWRAIGRMSMPIWLFLVGYAKTREIPVILWGGAIALMLGGLVFGQPVFNLNILFTIIVTRLILDGLTFIAFHNRESLIMTVITLTLLVIPLAFLFDYGTQAFLWAMVGYVIRQQNEMGWKNNAVLGFTLIVAVIYAIYQQLFFSFNDHETMIMGVCLATSIYFISTFRPKTYPAWTKKLPSPATGLLKIMGRHTLEIYVLHLLLFMAIAFFIFPENRALFDLRLY
jgi:hypothetical protein